MNGKAVYVHSEHHTWSVCLHSYLSPKTYLHTTQHIPQPIFPLSLFCSLFLYPLHFSFLHAFFHAHFFSFSCNICILFSCTILWYIYTVNNFWKVIFDTFNKLFSTCIFIYWKVPIAAAARKTIKNSPWWIYSYLSKNDGIILPVQEI